ncbi:hypothetical protein PHYPO_G00021540 [Pangasianodon hypophthalmus]|uniref:Parathyroid hormone n=1 Tax=Pangasianodon hypophthalmus TaxID=310915 RepID=A0A5N5MUT1_PANHP|nr:hypothetical protein PHYPO_G00021540 [Pangasianodon hypophthalmus]
MDKAILIILFWSLCSLVRLEGLPISKRSISEVQLMHNVGEHKQAVERQDWLQVKLKTVIIPVLARFDSLYSYFLSAVAVRQD